MKTFEILYNIISLFSKLIFQFIHALLMSDALSRISEINFSFHMKFIHPKFMVENSKKQV
jgi:hypothetical protein